MFLFRLDKNYGCYDNLYFPEFYNGKCGNLDICGKNTEMYIEQFSVFHMNFVQIAEFDWLPE